jgi:STE24 endopeptidase
VTAPTFTTLFLVAVALSFAIETWLALRQIASVRRHRDAVPPAFAGRVGVEAHRKAADYTIAHTRFAILSSLAGTLVLVALTRGRGVAFLTGLTGIVDAPPIVLDLLLIVAVVLVTGIVSLPFSLYRTFVIEQRFGFNRTTFATWAADLLKGLLVGALLGLPIAALVIWLMGSAGEAWWLWAWVRVDGVPARHPRALPDRHRPAVQQVHADARGPSRARIEALLARCGFASKGLFTMDGSKRSAHGNAYFTGFGRAKRIVMFDTLLDRLSPTRPRPCSRTSSGTSSSSTWPSASRGRR